MNLIFLLACRHTPPPPPPEPVWTEAEKIMPIERVAVVIRDTLAFETESLTMEEGAEDFLDQLAALLIRPQGVEHVVVNGHSAPDEINAYALSIDRARLVWEHLVRAGVDPGHISYRGVGATRSERVEGAHVSFDVVVYHHFERPPQPSIIDRDGVRDQLGARVQEEPASTSPAPLR